MLACSWQARGASGDIQPWVGTRWRIRDGEPTDDSKGKTAPTISYCGQSPVADTNGWKQRGSHAYRGGRRGAGQDDAAHGRMGSSARAGSGLGPWNEGGRTQDRP